MNSKDKLDLANPNFLDGIIDYRRIIVTFIALVSVFMVLMLPRLETDPTLRSGIDMTSDQYAKYQEFTNVFGNEEFIYVVFKNPPNASLAPSLDAVQQITPELENIDGISETVSLSTIKLFQKKGELFGNYPVIRKVNGISALPDEKEIEKMRAGLPLLQLLVSQDQTTFGFLVRPEDEKRYDPIAMKAILERINSIMQAGLPEKSDFRIIGSPLIRQAIVKYNIQTGIIFGVLCMLIGTVVSIYVFKSARITLITNLILGVCVLWVLGLMAFLRIPLNSTTALSFGFVPITTLEIVIHMVVRYHQFHADTKDKLSALKKSVRWLARPCFICTATTAVGFGTLMISSIPMVRQLGFIMGFGVLIAYGLAITLSPALFSAMKSFDEPEKSAMFRDWVDGFLGKLENAIFRYHSYFVLLGVGVTAVLFMGAPFIKSDTQILRMLSDKTKEVQDITFVEQNLAPVHSLELLIEAQDNSFKDPELWKRIAELESLLTKIPEVVLVDSYLPLLEYLHSVIKDSGSDKDLFTDPALIPQLLAITSLSSEGERIAKRYVDSDYSKLHIIVRFKNSPDSSIGDTIAKVQSAADKAMNGKAKAFVTGELAVIAHQTTNLINDQILSMFLAATLITIIMMIQMGSVTLGIICLIPNIPPVAAVFGIMGWFGISLDSVTVFAATVAIGLAVDNTIHFLTQLKREIHTSADGRIEQCVSRSYRLTAKQIAAWTLVTMFGFLALTVSPFRPVVFFGVLGCCSLLLGMYGDLIFLQSLILSSSKIRKSIYKLIARESGEPSDLVSKSASLGK